MGSYNDIYLILTLYYWYTSLKFLDWFIAVNRSQGKVSTVCRPFQGTIILINNTLGHRYPIRVKTDYRRLNDCPISAGVANVNYCWLESLLLEPSFLRPEYPTWFWHFTVDTDPQKIVEGLSKVNKKIVHYRSIQYDMNMWFSLMHTFSF